MSRAALGLGLACALLATLAAWRPAHTASHTAPNLHPAAAPAPGDDDAVVFEDRPKQLSFRPPSEFVWSEQSNPEMLAFEGPKSGGPAMLYVFSWPEGRPLDELAVALPGERIAFETTPELGDWPAALAWPGVEHAVTYTYTEKRKERVAGFAFLRHGPRVVMLSGDALARSFGDLTDAWEAAVSGLTLDPLVPAYIDAPTGLTFYDLPPGFEVDEDRTTPGTKIAWVFSLDGRRAADLLVKIEPAAGDQAAFDAWARSHVGRPEGDGTVTDSSVTPFHLSGRQGWLLEALISYGGGSSHTTRFEVVVQDDRHRFSLACYAEANHFAEAMRPVFDRFLRSITLGDS